MAVVTRSLTDRIIEIHYAALAAWHPDDPLDFPRFAWRLSSDVWLDLARWARGEYGWMIYESGSAQMLGWPLAEDATLPPNAILLEPA